MNYGELKTRALADSHREDFDTIVENFIAEGEALIETRLEAYPLEIQMDDLDRDENVYTIPASRVSLIRHVYVSGYELPLTQSDESTVGLSIAANSSVPTTYAVRPNGVLAFGGNPATDAIITVHFFGMPARLVDDTDTNDLLEDYPQLYIEAAQVYIYKRAQDYESAQIVNESVIALCRELNRRMKKMLGGAEAVSPYNLNFRSSY